MGHCFSTDSQTDTASNNGLTASLLLFLSIVAALLSPSTSTAFVSVSRALLLLLLMPRAACLSCLDLADLFEVLFQPFLHLLLSPLVFSRAQSHDPIPGERRRRDKAKKGIREEIKGWTSLRMTMMKTEERKKHKRTQRDPWMRCDAALLCFSSHSV